MIILRKAILAVACGSSVLLSGCSSLAVGAYPDPSIPKVSAADLARQQDAPKLQLELEWQFNGRVPAKNTSFMEITVPPPDMRQLRASLEQAFRKTGVIEIVREGGSGMIKVTLNNISNIGDAIDKGATLSRAWGDSHVTTKEEYELSLAIRSRGITVSFRRHAALTFQYWQNQNCQMIPGWAHQKLYLTIFWNRC